ncbi:MAG TPA: hypothetical protein VLF67_03545 [Candidatus Saccharimonas sp.]|nr:hypothetical protein [Candidatus Saccharimonas sp.]
MSLAPTQSPCPLCWANGLLQGGRVLGEGDVMYAYGFSDEAGTLKYALLVPKDHHPTPVTLPDGWGAEFGRLYAVVLEALKGAPHNGYWNEGYTAGQRVLGHWHVRVEPRFDGQPASSMGLGLLIAEYNKVMSA